jgi:hypothetical protein
LDTGRLWFTYINELKPIESSDRYKDKCRREHNMISSEMIRLRDDWRRTYIRIYYYTIINNIRYAHCPVTSW